MARKSKQAGGNMPLTHYERTKKFKSSEYGTTSKRLAGHSQYQLGDCALSLTKLGDTALCSPSGYLYSRDAILEYLLTKTQEIKEQQAAYDKQQQELSLKQDPSADEQRKRVADFEQAQKLVKKQKTVDPKAAALKDLTRVSYWLADAQPDAVQEILKPPPERPLSPHSQEPLRRKDLLEVSLEWQGDKLVCGVSDKPLTDATAYWTDKKKAGKLVSTLVYKDVMDGTCPSTGKKIKYTRKLQKSGTGYASSEQQTVVTKYAPTIT